MRSNGGRGSSSQSGVKFHTGHKLTQVNRFTRLLTVKKHFLETSENDNVFKDTAMTFDNFNIKNHAINEFSDKLFEEQVALLALQELDENFADSLPYDKGDFKVQHKNP